MTDHMEGLLQKLRSTEDALDERLQALEGTLKEQLDVLHADHAAAAGAWVLPFACIAASLVVLCGWGLRQWRQVSKLHRY